MSVKRAFAKRGVSWAVALLGIIFGCLSLVAVSQAYIPELSFHSTDYWPKTWVGFVGIVVFGSAFLTGSLIALRNRRRAAFIFFGSAPIVAFCLAFGGAGYLEWHADGGGYFESPFISSALWLALLFFIPFILPLLAIRSRKRAMFLFLIPALLLSPVFIFSRWTPSFLPELAGWSALFVIFGSFWIGIHKLGWPPLVSEQPKSLRRRFVSFALTAVLVATVDIAGTLMMTAARSSLLGECGDRHPFARPVSAQQVVMTTRLIWVGGARRETSGRTVGLVAIAIVDHQFWGPRMPRIVMLTNNIFWKNETYFIDGGRDDRLLTKFLPVISTGVCSRTRPLTDAKIDLRELQKAWPATKGVQIIGYVRKPEPVRSLLRFPPVPQAPMTNTQVTVSGSTGARVVTTDQDGIYEIDDLPPDLYTLKAALPDAQFAPDQSVTVTADAIGRRMIFERDFPVMWNGMIAGTVKDDAGHPAKAFVTLTYTDGSVIRGDAKSAAQTNPDGSFRLGEIPPGHFALAVDPYGPGKGSPYPPQTQGVRILDLSPGQRIEGIEFGVRPGIERKLQVRVSWPDGRPVKDARISVAYDRPPGYPSPVVSESQPNPDLNGVGEISVFGDSHVQVSAEGYLEDKFKSFDDSIRYSGSVDLQGSALPDHVNFVVDRSSRPVVK